MNESKNTAVHNILIPLSPSAYSLLPPPAPNPSKSPTGNH